MVFWVAVCFLSGLFAAASFADTEFAYNGYIAHQYAVVGQNPNSVIKAQNSELSKLYLDTNYTVDNWKVKFKPEFTYNHSGVYKDITSLNILENYLSYSGENIGFSVGKKIIGWGQGIVWSPANLVDSRVNPTNNLNQQSGSCIVALHGNDRGGISADIVYKPKLTITDPTFNYLSNPANDTIMFRLSAQEGQSDYAISFNYLSPYTVTGLEYSSTLDNGLIIYSESSVKSINQIYLKSLAGFRYDVTNDINLNVEYFYNGEGVGTARYPLIYATNQYQFAMLAKNYTLANLSYQKMEDKSRYSLMEIANLDDGSGVIRFGYSYDSSSSLVFSLDYNLFYGDRKSEFGSLPGSSGLIFGVRYYL